MIAVVCGNAKEFELWKTEYPERYSVIGAFPVHGLNDIRGKDFDEVRYYGTGLTIGDKEDVQAVIDRRLGWRK